MRRVARLLVSHVFGVIYFRHTSRRRERRGGDEKRSLAQRVVCVEYIVFAVYVK